MKSKIFKENRISKHYKTVATLLFSRGLRRKTSENGKKLLHGKHFFQRQFFGQKAGCEKAVGRLQVVRFVLSWDRGCVPIAFVATVLCNAFLRAVQSDRLALFVSGVPHACLLVVLLVCRGVLISLYYRLLKAAFSAVAGKVVLFLLRCGHLAFTVLRKCCR